MMDMSLKLCLTIIRVFGSLANTSFETLKDNNYTDSFYIPLSKKQTQIISLFVDVKFTN